MSNKTKSRNDIINYKKQRNLVVKLNNISKFEYFNKYDPNKQAKHFWVNCKPYFWNKHSKADTNIMFSENSELIMKNQDIANTLNDYFWSIVKSLYLFQWNEHNGEVFSKNVETIIENFRNHSSSKIIKKHFKNHITFTFRHVTTDEVKKIIHDLKNNKAASGEILVKILKNCGCIFDILKNCINQSIETSNFPDCLKTDNITSVFKKDDPLGKSKCDLLVFDLYFLKSTKN